MDANQINTAVTEAPMTLAQMKAHKEALEKQIADKQKSERDGINEQVLAALVAYDIPLNEFIKYARANTVKPEGLPAKYRDPVSGKTWTGRGATPEWLKGIAKEDRGAFEIKAEAAE